MKPVTNTIFGCLVLGALFAGTTLQAGPREDLAATVETVIKAVSNPANDTTTKKEAAVRKAIEEDFSLYAIARRSIGRGWEELSADQQGIYVEEFSKLLVANYAERYQEGIGLEVSWGDVTELGSRKMEIESTIKVDGEPISVLYRLVNLENRWQVYDLVIEGVSLVGNYREQFSAVLAKDGPDGLISLLKEKNAE